MDEVDGVVTDEHGVPIWIYCKVCDGTEGHWADDGTWVECEACLGTGGTTPDG